MGILQSTAGESKLKVPLSGIHPSTLMVCCIKVTPPKVEREVSMTMEVRELLSQVVLDMSRHVSGNSTAKRLKLMVALTPLSHKLGDLSSAVDMSSQVSTPDDAEMGMPPWERSLLPPCPQMRHQGPVAASLLQR